MGMATPNIRQALRAGSAYLEPPLTENELEAMAVQLGSSLDNLPERLDALYPEFNIAERERQKRKMIWEKQVGHV